jgi:hypothetical protein
MTLDNRVLLCSNPMMQVAKQPAQDDFDSPAVGARLLVWRPGAADSRGIGAF